MFQHGVPSLHTTVSTNGTDKLLKAPPHSLAGQQAEGGVGRRQLGNILTVCYHANHDFVDVAGYGDANDLREGITQSPQYRVL